MQRRYELAVFADEQRTGLAKAAGSRIASQSSLFAVANESAIDALREVDIDSLSPEDAKRMLAEVRSKMV